MKKGWELKKLGDVCTVIAGQSPEGKYYNTEQNGLPFYQGKKEFTDKYLGSPTKWTSKITKEAILTVGAFVTSAAASVAILSKSVSAAHNNVASHTNNAIASYEQETAIGSHGHHGSHSNTHSNAHSSY